jgi:beta-lactamase class A
MKKTLLVILLIAAQCTLQAQKADKILARKLTELTKAFHGDVGLYVKHLGTGKTVAINADSIFPTASMIKIPITIGVFDKIEKEELQYDSVLTYYDSLLYPGEDILGSFKQGEKISLSKVIMLMLTTSDNTASLWCQHLAGTGVTINKWLEQSGYVTTRVNSRTPGRESNRAKYGWGQTSPREMARLVASIHQKAVVSARTSERIYRNLTHIFLDDVALSQIPPYVQTASKQGAVDHSKSEVVLVNAPHGDYVFCVITKNQKDDRWVSENEGYVLIRNVSRTLWEYFEPRSKWQPAEKIEDWR